MRYLQRFRYFPFSPNQCIILTLKQTKNSDSTINSRVSAATQGTPGTIGRKIYCTFWCRTGNCDYTQQGCKFLHEIPPDEATRKWMGLRDYPTWMVEPPRGPRLAKTSSADKMQEGNWRRGKTQDNQRVLPASPTPGHGRAVSHIVTSVPYLGSVQTSSLTQTPTITTAVTGSQPSGPRFQKLHEFQAAQQAALRDGQQAALLLPPQQYFPSSSGSVIQPRPKMQFDTFDGADGNMSFQSITSEGQEVFRFQYPTNDVFSNSTVVGTNERHPAPTRQPPISRPGLSAQVPNTSLKANNTTNNEVFSNSTVVGMNKRHPIPTRQPPISRPVLSAQAPSTPLKGNDTTNRTMYTPSQNTADTVPQASAPTTSNTTISAHAMKANQKAFSSNGSQRSTSRARTPSSSGANNAAASDGADQTLSSLIDGSTPSPPIMHRRLFVAPGEPRYMPNPVVTMSSKSRQHSRSKRGANAKGRGYGGGKAGQWAKARGQDGQEEDLVPLLATEDRSEG